MDDSGYYTRCVGDFKVCSPQNSAHSIFSLKFSDLPASEYSHFLHGFRDEQDFEEFKHDLRDFQQLKHERCCKFVDGSDAGSDELIDLTELQFICKPNYVCRSRRAYASRSGQLCDRGPVMPVKPSLRLLPTVVQGASSSADTPSQTRHKAALRDGSLHFPSDSLAPETPGSSCCTDRVGRTAGSLGCDTSDGLEPSISDVLMEFLNEDEHFLEFETVFEAVRSRRMSRDLDTCRPPHVGPVSSHTDTHCRLSSTIHTGRCSQLENATRDKSVKNIQQASLVSDIFADFFDNDESFLEFEKEFENFRSVRRSYLLGSGKDLSSTNGVCNHPNVGCDKDSGSYTCNCCAHNELACHRPFLCSAKDWTKMIRKIRRSSCMSVDSRTDTRSFRHRYSVGEVSEDYKHTEGQHKAHSVSDLRRYHKRGLSPGSSQQQISEHESRLSKQVARSLNIQPTSRSVQHVLTREHDFSLQNSRSRDESSSTDSFPDGKDSASEQWPAKSENRSRSSSPSHCCSSSCFCQSDLFIEEAWDKPQLPGDPPQSSRVRSSSPLDLGSQSPIADFRLHTNSLDKLNSPKSCRGSESPLPDLPLQGFSDSNAEYFRDGDPDDSASVSPPSTSCSHLSDADSEHYHTAASDLSGAYSTAKSNLSLLIDRLESTLIDQRVCLDCPQEPVPGCGSDLSHDTFGRTKTQEDPWVPRDQYHSHKSQEDRWVPRDQYHGHKSRDVWAQYRDNRPRSAPACQYTCHEHCVPAVTLSCKSVSGDGCDVAAARTPSPAEPRSHGEACLFMGSIQARPGAARIVSGCTVDSPPPGAPHASESVPNFYHLAHGREGSGHMDTPRPANIALHHRSWSISEDIVTPHSYPIEHLGVVSDPARRSSPTPRTSAPPCQPSYSDSRFDSFPRKDTSGYAAAPRAESGCTGGGIILSQHARGGEGPAGEASALDLSDVHRRDEDTSPEAATEKDETDSGYRSGTIPDDKLPRVPSQATLDQQELKRKVAKYNHFVPAACLEVTGKESFQGFMKVTMNLIRPITMELGARPPSIYELLTREHIVEENTQHVAFYMPRDTHKSLHITSDTTTKEVIASLLKKFHILDHPRKFAMYEQEFSDRNKLVRLRRLTDKDCPLRSMVNWDPERIKNYRMVLQENETGEIVWDAFSLPELNNFLRVLDREERETVIDLKHKYAYMKQYMERRMAELRGECTRKTKPKT